MFSLLSDKISLMGYYWVGWLADCNLLQKQHSTISKWHNMGFCEPVWMICTFYSSHDKGGVRVVSILSTVAFKHKCTQIVSTSYFMAALLSLCHVTIYLVDRSITIWRDFPYVRCWKEPTTLNPARPNFTTNWKGTLRMTARGRWNVDVVLRATDQYSNFHL